MASDTWFRRELPTLEAIVSALDDAPPGQTVRLGEIAERTSLSDDEVAKACLRLELAYIELTKTMGSTGSWVVRNVSASALTATGAWPTPERLAQQILDGLAQEADREADPQKASRLRAAATALGEGARDVGVSVLATVIARQTGLG